MLLERNFRDGKRNIKSESSTWCRQKPERCPRVSQSWALLCWNVSKSCKKNSQWFEKEKCVDKWMSKEQIRFQSSLSFFKFSLLSCPQLCHIVASRNFKRLKLFLKNFHRKNCANFFNLGKNATSLKLVLNFISYSILREKKSTKFA